MTNSAIEENIDYKTKEVTPELVSRILEQQEKLVEIALKSQKQIRVRQSFFDGVFSRKISTDLKIDCELTGEDAVWFQYLPAPKFCYVGEDPLYCLKAIGENPDEYDIAELYEKVMKEYYKKHMIVPQVNFSTFDQVQSYTERLLNEAKNYFRSAQPILEVAQSEHPDN